MALLAGVLVAATPAAVGVEPLTLRINDAVAPPGGTAAIVLRTYASRPIEQGQLCLQAVPATGTDGAAVSTGGAEVYSAGDDVSTMFHAELVPAVQQFVIAFDSPSATVNAIDGPLAVVFLDLDPTLTPGQTFELVVDEPNTFLRDEFGNPIAIEPRNGTLTVRDPAGPFTLGVEAETVAPGGTARISLQTLESLPLASGRVGVVYDPAIAAGPPTAHVDPRYGEAAVTLEAPLPGLTIVNFEAIGDSFNRIPGNVITLLVPTSPSVPNGTTSPVFPESGSTLQSLGGQTLGLLLEGDELMFDGSLATAGEVDGLTVTLVGEGDLGLSWSSACGAPDGYSVYRGDLAEGYASAVPIGSECAQQGTSATVPAIPGVSEFFLVAPYREGLAGSYGDRVPVDGACFPQEAGAGVCATGL